MPKRQSLAVEYRAPASLKPRAANPRTHSKKQIRQIARSIERFGFVNPILLDHEGFIIAGHGRCAAAALLGLTEVPVIHLHDLTEDEIRAYVIADNKLAENAGWDRELLALELHYLEELDIDFDITITGFEVPEIDGLIGELEAADEPDDLDVTPPVTRDNPPVTRPGDLWIIGKHRLLCADATQPGSYRQLLGKDRAEMVFTDPPYNVPIAGHASGLGQANHREFAMASGEMSHEEFIGFLSPVFGHLSAHSVSGSIHFICMDWRHMSEVLEAGCKAYRELKNLCVWTKTNGGMGSLYRSQHELVFVFKSGDAPHINNIELGRHGRNRTNVWSYPGVNTFRKDRDAALALHPTVKPVKLVADAILDCSSRGGIVLDVFAGSGTTFVAAERTGRRAYGLEIDPHYCDSILRRLASTFNLKPTHAETGRRFADLEREDQNGRLPNGGPSQSPLAIAGGRHE